MEVGCPQNVHLVQEKSMWVGLFQLFEQVCRQCIVCLVSKGAEAQIPPPLTWYISAPLKVLTIGFLTLDMSEDRYHHILVMVDHLSSLPWQEDASKENCKHNGRKYLK